VSRFEELGIGWMESRKQAVSIRMSASDVRKIKRLAERLGVRDSDVIRFAVRSMLGKLGPLHDPTVRGRSLVPVLLDCGQELYHFFDLDAVRLDGILNEGVEPEMRVSREDIQLIAMNGSRQPYLRWSVEQRAAQSAQRSGPAAPKNPGNGAGPHDDVNGAVRLRHEEVVSERDGSERGGLTVRAYLYQKYLYGDGDPR
jgi:hypothetical protein